MSARHHPRTALPYPTHHSRILPFLSTPTIPLPPIFTHALPFLNTFMPSPAPLPHCTHAHSCLPIITRALLVLYAHPHAHPRPHHLITRLLPLTSTSLPPASHALSHHHNIHHIHHHSPFPSHFQHLSTPSPPQHSPLTYPHLTTALSLLYLHPLLL